MGGGLLLAHTVAHNRRLSVSPEVPQAKANELQKAKKKSNEEEEEKEEEGEVDGQRDKDEQTPSKREWKVLCFMLNCGISIKKN